MARSPNSDEAREQEESLGEGPGESLRKLRERNETAVATVAAHLHLTTPMLEALERDDYQELPDPVFVRGYIRSYARLFESDADPIVAAYNRATQTEPGEPRHTAPAARAAVGRRRESSLVATLLGLMMACGLGAATWWWYQSQLTPGDGQSETDTLAETPAGMEPAAVSAEARHPGATIPDPERTVALSEVTAFDPDRMEMEADAEQFETEVESTGSSFGPESDPAEAEGAALDVVVVPSEEPASDDPQVVLATPQSLEATQQAADEPAEQTASGVATTTMSSSAEPGLSPPPVAPVTGQSTLVLAFVADTWVEIRDADRVRKLMGIMKANTEQVVKGRKPFFLTLGNSEGVTVTFNGEPVDHTPFTRGNVARFKLGGTESGTVMQ